MPWAEAPSQAPADGTTVNTASTNTPAPKKKKSNLGAILGGAIGGGVGGLAVLAAAAYFLMRKKGSPSSSFAVGNPTFAPQSGAAERGGMPAGRLLCMHALNGRGWIRPCRPCPYLPQAAQAPPLLWPRPRVPLPRLAWSWRRWVWCLPHCLRWLSRQTCVPFLRAAAPPMPPSLQVIEQTGTPRSARRRVATPFQDGEGTS